VDPPKGIWRDARHRASASFSSSANLVDLSAATWYRPFLAGLNNPGFPILDIQYFCVVPGQGRAFRLLVARWASSATQL
jgi:hypothetical protein